MYALGAGQSRARLGLLSPSLPRPILLTNVNMVSPPSLWAPLECPYAASRTDALSPLQSCQNIRNNLAECLLRTDCVLRSDPPRTPSDCLKNHHDELPDECKQLRKSFFECKRGMVSRPQRMKATD